MASTMTLGGIGVTFRLFCRADNANLDYGQQFVDEELVIEAKGL